MPLNLASPGIVVREVDLTVGRVDPTSASIGAIVSPFAQGPVDVPTLVENEKDLLETFGKPYSTDKHYEHWLTASSYLAYGGNLSVVRADDSGLVNGYVGTGSSAKVKSVDHYEELGYDENPITNVTVIARNPGSWGNGLRVGILDSRADQTITVASTAGMAVGYGVTQQFHQTILAGAGSTSLLDGHFKGIITRINGTSVDVKLLEHVPASGTATEVDYQPSGVYQFSTTGALAVMNNSGSNAANTTVSATLDWFDQQTLNLTGTTTVSGILLQIVQEPPSMQQQEIHVLMKFML